MRKNNNHSNQEPHIPYGLTSTQVKESADQDEDMEILHPSRSEKISFPIRKTLLYTVPILSLLIILMIIYFLLPGKSPVSQTSDNAYVLSSSFYQTYPNITQIKGKHKEAYVFVMCNARDDLKEGNFYFESLLGFILRLKKVRADQNRDIIVLGCEETFEYQFDIFYKLGVIIHPIHLIKSNREYGRPNWKYVFTKILIYQLIMWDKVLFLDIDLLCDDRLITIWDEPANRIVTEPPKGVNLDDVWFGQPIRSLYPYMQANTYDTWTPLSKIGKILNGGIFIYKPSIAHFNMLMNIVNNVTIELFNMDQTVLQIAYNSTGPVPWVAFNETYNITPLLYNPADWIICWHGKFWHHENSPYLNGIWIAGNKEMKKDLYNISIISEKHECSITNQSLTIDGLNITHGTGILYYMVTKNFTFFPSYEEIKDAYLKSADNYVLIVRDKLGGFTVDNLLSNTMYRIHYYAETSSRYNPVTDIYYRNCTTS